MGRVEGAVVEGGAVVFRAAVEATPSGVWECRQQCQCRSRSLVVQTTSVVGLECGRGSRFCCRHPAGTVGRRHDALLVCLGGQEGVHLRSLLAMGGHRGPPVVVLDRAALSAWPAFVIGVSTCACVTGLECGLECGREQVVCHVHAMRIIVFAVGTLSEVAACTSTLTASLDAPTGHTCHPSRHASHAPPCSNLFDVPLGMTTTYSVGG